jgi:hypothetical protein
VTDCPVADPSETLASGERREIANLLERLLPYLRGETRHEVKVRSERLREGLAFTSDAETLALIAEHGLRLVPEMFGEWFVAQEYGGDAHGRGATIGDAVRACVAKIKGQA